MTTEPPPGRNREQALTDEVVASFAATTDPRLREVMQSLVRHLHAFAREVRLGEHEWQAAIDFLTRAGHITDERRQEFILLSDVLGLSMLTVAINGPERPRPRRLPPGRPMDEHGVRSRAAPRVGATAGCCPPRSAAPPRAPGAACVHLISSV